MKKILLLDPATSSLNLGDEIISDAVCKGIKHVIEHNFITTISSHLPISLMYERSIGKCDYKFVCGSNLLMGKLNGIFKQWHITYKDVPFLKDVILIGVGWWQYNNKPNLYTKLLYKLILNKKYLHSVRDSYTENMLKSIGIHNVINTGCPTLWTLTPEHCQKISKNKTENVVFTLTDYNENVNADKQMIRILLENYKKVYFWGQGIGDYEYLHKLGFENDVIIVEPSLKAYDKILEKEDVDYIGTRLHGGIRAIQHLKRAIIISVDNRAREISRDFGVNILERNEMDKLPEIIYKEIETKITLPWDNIQMWKEQFR